MGLTYKGKSIHKQLSVLPLNKLEILVDNIFSAYKADWEPQYLQCMDQVVAIIKEAISNYPENRNEYYSRLKSYDKHFIKDQLH
jgi:hypothetical protein